MAMRIPLEYIDYSLMFGANIRPWVELWACPKSWTLSLAICEHLSKKVHGQPMRRRRRPRRPRRLEVQSLQGRTNQPS